MHELMTTTNHEGPLSEAEQKKLAECEAIIETGLAEFVKVGNALLAIRNDKLYREQYGTFEEYCKARWSFGYEQGRRLIKAAEVVQNLKGTGQTHRVGGNVPADSKNVVNTPEPTSETQVRHLGGLSADQQQAAWKKASETAKDPAKPTEAEVKAAVKEVKKQESNGAKVKESELKIIDYLRGKKQEGATSDQIETDTGVAHQRVSELLEKKTAVYQTQGGKRMRRTTSGKHKGYVIVLAEFAEAAPPPPKETARVVKSGKPAKPEDHVPAVLLGFGVITADRLVRGDAVRKEGKDKDEWSVLPIGQSKLRYLETRSFTMAGSASLEERRAFHKWGRYDSKNIEEKVLKVLEQMNPLEIPKHDKQAAVTYAYNLNVACDLRELAEMLCGQLLRRAEMLENRERFGHLYATKELHSGGT